jgi:hypothetical protein
MAGCWVPSQVAEETSGVLPRLPGCNPVQDGPGNATQQTGCGAPTQTSAPQWPFTDLTASKRVYYLGCGKDSMGQGRTLAGASTSADDMTVEKCVDFCTSKGYSKAGLENARECFCGNTIAPDRAPVKGWLGPCEMRCTGNAKQKCGGWGYISLYEKCGSGGCTNAAVM